MCRTHERQQSCDRSLPPASITTLFTAPATSLRLHDHGLLDLRNLIGGYVLSLVLYPPQRSLQYIIPPRLHKYCAIGVATPATGRPEVACTAKPLCHTLQCYITRMDFWRSLEQRWRYRALREPGLQLRTGNYHSICSKHKKGLHGSWKARSGPHPSTRSRVTIAPRIIHRNAIGVCKTSMALWRG